MAKETNTIVRMFKSTGIFFVGNVLSKLMQFFLLPIYTKYITAGDFGYYDISLTYTTIATSILFFDIWVSTMRLMYDQDCVEWKNKVILSGCSIFAVSSVVYVILATLLDRFVNIDFLALIVLYGISLNISNMYTYPSRGLGKNVAYAVSGIINTTVTITINIILIVFLKWGLMSLYVAVILGNFSQILYLEQKTRLLRNLRWKIYDRVLTKRILIYTLPLCINSVAYWLLTSYNRLVINESLSFSYNGIYAIGSKFAVAVTLFASCFTFAWQDISFSRGNDGSLFYSKACRLYLIFLGIGTVLLIPAFNMLFPFIVDESYWMAKDLIPLFLVCSVISSYSTFIGNIFYAIKDTRTIFISMVLSCITNLMLCHAFIDLWGLNGANFSIAASFLLNIIIRYFVLRKKIQLSFDVKSTVIVVAGIAMSMFVFENYSVWVNAAWLVISGLCLVFIFRNDINGVLVKLGFQNNVCGKICNKS